MFCHMFTWTSMHLQHLIYAQTNPNATRTPYSSWIPNAIRIFHLLALITHPNILFLVILFEIMLKIPIFTHYISIALLNIKQVILF